ncbi:MAG: SiaC family regulatory phosphoprotein, partial [Bacteroidota bacterium]|nr:SiaC family regulatory phosphoprotein [Bacteroidota bacterium]
KLDYFNSASTKKIFEIITILEKLSSNNLPVTVIWYHTKDDELIRNRGLEIKEMVELPFEVKIY